MPKKIAQKNKMELRVSIKDDLGLDIPNGDTGLREAIGQALIDTIIGRTQSGRNVNGRTFTKYSDSYKEATGKKDPPNLTLSSDMLESLDVIKVTNEFITIAIAQSDQTPKAFNHDQGDTLPRREFLGIQKRELKSIASKFKKSEITEEETQVIDEEIAEAEAFVDFLLSTGEVIKFG